MDGIMLDGNLKYIHVKRVNLYFQYGFLSNYLVLVVNMHQCDWKMSNDKNKLIKLNDWNR